MSRIFFISGFAVATTCGALWAQDEIAEELKASSQEHMREELGVNPVTSPSIAGLLKDLESFRPVPLKVIETSDHGANFSNRLQTALHFGSLVADGFLLTIAERPQDVQNIGRELIRQSRALGVGERLAKRSKSLLELSDKGDWVGMREELVKTQEDVEESMMELHDEEMAHMVSLGGWLRGFQLGAISTDERYSAPKAEILGRVEVMDYFLDRLDTLNPRLKATEMVREFIDRIKKIRLVAIEAQGQPPTADQVAKMRDLADQAERIATAKVDREGNFVDEPKL
ncbi:MAG: hypothetical protein ACOVLK_03975 [Terrimicrobiaceae bacterium]